LVQSLNRPGGNVTGVTFFSAALGRLGLLRDLVRKSDLIAVVLNPTFPDAARERREIEEAAQSIGQRITILHASDGKEIETVFEALVGMRAGGLLVCADPFFIAERAQFAALAAPSRDSGDLRGP
jgi:putative ABC transport system substrate-binding protein